MKKKKNCYCDTQLTAAINSFSLSNQAGESPKKTRKFQFLLGITEGTKQKQQTKKK